MTAAVLDFTRVGDGPPKLRYDDEELDQLAKRVAEVLAPVFEANGWDAGSVAEIALATRRLLQMAAELPPSRMVSLGRIVVHRDEDELRVYLHLDAVMPVDDEGR